MPTATLWSSASSAANCYRDPCTGAFTPSPGPPGCEPPAGSRVNGEWVAADAPRAGRAQARQPRAVGARRGVAMVGFRPRGHADAAALPCEDTAPAIGPECRIARGAAARREAARACLSPAGHAPRVGTLQESGWCQPQPPCRSGRRSSGRLWRWRSQTWRRPWPSSSVPLPGGSSPRFFSVRQRSASIGVFTGWEEAACSGAAGGKGPARGSQPRPALPERQGEA